MDDKRKTVALAIAKDLDGQLGGGVLAAMQSDKKTRTLGFSEGAAVVYSPEPMPI